LSWDEVEKATPEELLKKEMEYWDNVHPDSVGPLSSDVIVPIIKNIIKITPRRVLDFGCGTGRLLGLFDLDNIQYVGLDISKKKLLLAEEKIKDKGILVWNGVNRGIPFLDKYFNLIICYSVFTHTSPQQTEEILREFARVLSDDGQMFVSIIEDTFSPIGNWVVTNRGWFYTLIDKYGLKICGETHIPEIVKVYQTLFVLEKKK